MNAPLYPSPGHENAGAAPAPAVGARFVGQWNWGAALLTPFWLMTHRRAGIGIIVLVVGLIPFLSLANLGFLVYFGINGNRIAVLSGRFSNEAEFVAVQNAWRNWAFGLTAFFLVLLVGIAVIDQLLSAGHKAS